MFKHYIKYIIRLLIHNKLSTTINLVGIVLGLLVSILLLFLVKSQFETDLFHKNADHIYKFENRDGEHMSVPKINLVKKYVPEVEHITYFHQSWSKSDFLNYKNNRYQINDMICADSAFFNVFNFESVFGDLSQCLARPNSLVLTSSEAEKIFENQNPVGELVEVYSSEFEKKMYTVTAVIKDIPPTSSMQFKSVISMGSRMEIKWYRENANHWGTHNYLAYALLNENCNPKEVGKRIDQLIIENGPEWTRSATPVKLLPFNGLYLDKNPVQKSMILVLGSIGILILIIACINYFNLSATQLMGSIKNEGIIQTLGDSRHAVITRFFIQTSLLFCLGIAIVLFLLKLVLPYFNSLSNSSFQYSDLFRGSNSILLLGVVLGSIGIFSIFPPLIISRFKTIQLLSKNISNKKSKLSFNKGLLVFQFLISIILITSTFFMYKQNRFMLNSDYGFTTENIMAIHMNPESWNNEVALNHQYKSLSEIDKIAYSSNLLTEVSSDWGRTMFHKDSSFHVSFVNLFVDENFLDLFDIPLVRGNGFKENPTKRNNLIVNKQFIEHYGITDIASASLTRDRTEGVLRGVCENFNFKTFHTVIQPFGLLQAKEECSEMLVKFNCTNTADISNMLNEMETIWNAHSPSYPFEYVFYDQQLQYVYQGEIRLFKTFMIASVISLLVAGLGLFGISLYLINNKIKEIGIRKVNGAKVTEILTLLNRDFIKWVAIAFVIACPIAYYAMDKWLENFAYKTNLSWWIFALAGVLALGIALLTVSWQSWRAASRNPVEALRYE
ncbi:ABC transporter permease [uncultured Draconibacterium sp.]|uniref:ABC transporter permease n=1 Tax=uncultured Draconibacterium sp. TaxID=1573823 RepID=UPI0025CC589F|nr:ABC transporter permease [uncultured Draconibacterium sp.]